MKAMVAVLMISTNALAVSVPNFTCTDIHGIRTNITNENSYFNPNLPADYGSFIYDLANGAEVDIVNSKNDDGYYYGNVYLDKSYKFYYDIKCKLIP